MNVIRHATSWLDAPPAAKGGTPRQSFARWLLVLLSVAGVQGFQANPPVNFQAERELADKLFQEGNALAALPLYEDLAKQDPQRAVFAERHAAGLIAKAATVADQKEKTEFLRQAFAELLRARRLGDNSNYANVEIDSLQSLLDPAARKPVVPASPGYRESSNPKVVAAMQAGEAAFARNDYRSAIQAYAAAAKEEPSFYGAPLFAGDAAFRLHDAAVAGQWFQTAISIDPKRETAYRYWGDALMSVHQPDAARDKFMEAVIAEPYNPSSWAGLQQWAQMTHALFAPPQMQRPAACAEVHLLAALTDCIRKNLPPKPSDPGAQSLADLDQHQMLPEWILLHSGDATVIPEYAAFRDTHREQLRAYILRYVLHQ